MEHQSSWTTDEEFADALLLLRGGDVDAGGISRPIYPMQDDDLATYEKYTIDVLMSPESGFASDSPATIPSPDSIYIDANESSSGPYLQIIEQPEERFRFRYLKEAKVPHGPIFGCNSNHKGIASRRKTDFGPKVKLFNFTGEAIIRCWLTLPGKIGHPNIHQLVVTGKEVTDQTRDPHLIKVNDSNRYTASFDKLNIIHVVTKNLTDQKDYWRRKHLINAPFRATSENITAEFNKTAIEEEIKLAEKNVASLYFEAFANIDGEYKRICDPVTSRAIRNKKNPKFNVLRIFKHLPSQGTCEGNDEVILLVDKIVKDVKIRFFEVSDEGEEIWSAVVDPDEVHKQVAIVFRTPPYRTNDITTPVVVLFKLVRNDDESHPKKFIYTPSTSLTIGKKRRIDAVLQQRDEEQLEKLHTEKKETPVHFDNFPSAESSSYRSLSEINVSLPSTSAPFLGHIDASSAVPPRNMLVQASSILEHEEAAFFDHYLETDGIGCGGGLERTTRANSDKSPMPDLIDKVQLRSKLSRLMKESSLRSFEVSQNQPPARGDTSQSPRHHHEYCCSNHDLLPLGHRLLYSGEISRWRSFPSYIGDCLKQYNTAGETVILAAIKMNDVDTVKTILRLRPSYIDQTTLTGEDGPFHVAVKNRRHDIMKILIKVEHRWNNVNGSNLTPLHYAVRFGDVGLIKLLLESSEVDIRPKLKVKADNEEDDSTDDDEYYSSDSDDDDKCSKILKGPPLNRFISNQTIFDILLRLSSTSSSKPRPTYDDLKTAECETVCLKLAEALNLQFLTVSGSKQPMNIIKNYLEAKFGPKEAAEKIERALSSLSV